MYKWNIYFHDSLNNIRKNFTIKASSKQDAIEKAVQKVNNRNLNNFTITLNNF